MGKLGKGLLTLVLGVTVGVVAGCGSAQAGSQETTKVKLGVVGDSNEVWEPIIEQLKQEKIEIELVKFSDYTQPNEALEKGDIDLNAFQGYILMDEFNATNEGHLVAIGETVLNPIGLYSDKYDSLEAIADQSEVAIANDPVNGARGLLLLQSAGLIQLEYDEGRNPTISDIVENPKELKIVELEAAQTARSLPDVGASVINVFMALDAGFVPKEDAIFIEPVNEDSKPYYNIIVTREENKENAVYQKIVDAYRSDASKALIDQLYKGSVLPLW
ncbi:MetQ/NlpA family ABC transporter substrate-binding protein [Enterococcus alcedinis]|uniref:Lipoprotein n=1 Tax=Enterococcus alcedinis TaxID=1274384 RepID=A0A917JF57_9ENTE|nr:MetQ/NlpA family ABC transporter substrate-binding protein [Enterococcus alcedinis]MBP2102079.1 D-methionine transport system substrate-binding protein [Enterococcus alcedinis]GGI65641.1 lipoprotein [Enterococcus alcedinis]